MENVSRETCRYGHRLSFGFVVVGETALAALLSFYGGVGKASMRCIEALFHVKHLLGNANGQADGVFRVLALKARIHTGGTHHSQTTSDGV